MNKQGNMGQSNGRTSKDDLLRRLEELTDGAGLNGQGEGNELSEAERLARDAVKPKRRVDGELPGTARQKPMTSSMMEFAKALIEGKTQEQAYRDAYPDAQASQRSIKASAWRLSQDPRIKSLVQEHWGETVEALAEDSAATKRFVLKTLLHMVRSGKQENTQLRALELMGKTVGMFAKVEEKTEDVSLSPEQLKRELSVHLRLLSNVRPLQSINQSVNQSISPDVYISINQSVRPHI